MDRAGDHNINTDACWVDGMRRITVSEVRMRRRYKLYRFLLMMFLNTDLRDVIGTFNGLLHGATPLKRLEQYNPSILSSQDCRHSKQHTIWRHQQPTTVPKLQAFHGIINYIYDCRVASSVHSIRPPPPLPPQTATL